MPLDIQGSKENQILLSSIQLEGSAVKLFVRQSQNCRRKDFSHLVYLDKEEAKI